jgi:glycosyltransferase involved in cell wall biosynthesis
MKTLAGILAVRNGFRGDYCWVEAAKSLLGVCDELVLADCDSSDGTSEAMRDWAAKDSRITLCNFPWTDPRGTNQWWVDFLNYARQHAKSEWIVQVDADELIHEKDYPEIRAAADEGKVLICERYNFWASAQTLIPHGHCCGHEVVRVGPANVVMPSDYPCTGSDTIMSMAVPSTVGIYHYGFVRKKEAWWYKAREVHRIWNGDGPLDPRLVAAEEEGGEWARNHKVAEWVKDLVPFTGTHPAIIHPWLIERGYTI